MTTEWQTVKRSGYMPPHMRSKMEAEAKKDYVPDVKSKSDFPEFLSAPVKKSTWGGDKSFKEKIDDLIALDKMSEIERQQKREAEEAMRGWESLNIPTRDNKAWFIAFNERLVSQKDDEEELYIQLSKQVPPPIRTPPPDDDFQEQDEYDNSSVASYDSHDTYDYDHQTFDMRDEI